MHMKNKIRKAFESATPDVLNRVLQSCPAGESGTAIEPAVVAVQHNWFREVASTAAALVLLIGVCAGAIWTLGNIELVPAGPTDPSFSTVPSTETTAPSTEPMETTEPIQTDPPVHEYIMAPDGYYPFVFDGVRQPYQGFGPELDLSKLEKGYLYVHDQSADQVYQISDGPVQTFADNAVFASTMDHLYYVSSADPTVVVREDYHGQGRALIYQSKDAQINDVNYYGNNAQGKLYLVEDAKQVVCYSVGTGLAEVVLEMPYIETALYSDYEEPPHIMWYGKVSETEEANFYCYYMYTGENVIVGENSEDPPVTELYWYVEDPETMSYEKFFSVDRPLPGFRGDTAAWTASTGTKYTLMATNMGLHVRQEQGGICYTIPGSEDFRYGVTPIQCNGKTAYVHSDTQLLRIDILTGETAVVAEFERMVDACSNGPYLLYYAAVTGDSISIYQLYTPTETLETLYSGISPDTVYEWFQLDDRIHTQDPVTWTMINPKAYEILKREVGNFDSVLLTDRNYIELWADPQKLNMLEYGGHTRSLLQLVQEHFGVRALLEGSYDPIGGTYSEREGVIDDCWFGSGKGCDHFAPDETADIIPTVIDTKVTQLPALTPPTAEMAEQLRKEGWGSSNRYAVKGEVYDYYYLYADETRVCDVPMKESHHAVHTKNGTYIQSATNHIVWLGLNGVATEIYAAQYGELTALSYSNGRLCFVDGDHIVVIDLVECTCSVVLYHPGRMYVDFETENELFVDVTLGLNVRAYIFNFETGALAQTTPRL